METIQIGNVRLVVAPDDAVDHQWECSTPTSKPRQKAKLRKSISQAKLIFARAHLHRIKNVRKVGHGGLIDQPIKTNGWLVTPPGMYEGIIPREAMPTAEILTKGIPIKGFLIADDQRVNEQVQQNSAARQQTISLDWGKIATGVGKVAAAVAVAGAVISFLPLVLGIGAIGIALSYDPLLIAVTAEDEWICVYEWWH